MIALKTNRLLLRDICHHDSEFMLRLLNEPAWHKFIASHSIDTVAKASEYIDQKIRAMYREYGFGLWLAERIADSAPVGICGVVKRDFLPHIDLGFALSSEYWNLGYASEAAIGCMAYARERLNADKVLAIVSPANSRSIQLLTKIGFQFESQFSHPGSDEVLSLYAAK